MNILPVPQELSDAVVLGEVDDGSHRILRTEATVRVIESTLTTEKADFKK